jgi:barstar (barnase inhibitor)
MTWANLAQRLPWLRGQAVHLAVQETQQVIAETAVSVGFTVLTGAAGHAAGPYRGVLDALELPVTAEANLDALADALRDLPSQWPGIDRLALFVPDADTLIRADLLGWTQLCLVLGQASATLWDRDQLVFETVFFVPAGWFGADAPA